MRAEFKRTVRSCCSPSSPSNPGEEVGGSALILSRIFHMVTYYKAKWEETKLDHLNRCQEKKQALTAQVCGERTSHSTLQASLRGQQTGLRWAKPISCALRQVCSASFWSAGTWTLGFQDLTGKSVKAKFSLWEREKKKKRKSLNFCLSLPYHTQATLPNWIKALR